MNRSKFRIEKAPFSQNSVIIDFLENSVFNKINHTVFFFNKQRTLTVLCSVVKHVGCG